MLIDDNRVFISCDTSAYCQIAPFDPSEPYPEMSGRSCGSVDNPAYRAFRNLLRSMNLDANRKDSPEWNPLGEIITSGNTVVLKPNFVSHRNKRNDENDRLDLDCLITHGSVLRVVLDYVALALHGSGKIVIADCPLQSADWSEICRVAGLKAICEYACKHYPEIALELSDYRLWRSVYRNGYMVSGELSGEGLERHQEMDLGSQSLLVPLMKEGVEFGVTQYPKNKMRAAHTPDVNKYLCPQAFLAADVVINLPKMKTHMKAGLTCALKNFVGINGHKDYLPHFRYGSPKTGGDEYPDGNALWDLVWKISHLSWDAENIFIKNLWRRLSRLIQLTGYATRILDPHQFRSGGGGWYGNDTLWRTILDINRAFFYFDRDKGSMGETPWQGTRYVAFLDGLVGGDKSSPLAPTPVKSGFMLGAFNPLALDTVASALMGLDYRKIKQISKGFQIDPLPLATFAPEDIKIIGDVSVDSVLDIFNKRFYRNFEPTIGWKGNIEWDEEK